MREHSWRTAAAALLGGVFSTAAAATEVVRCIGAQGEPMFAQTCAQPASRTRPAAATAMPRAAAVAQDCARTPEHLREAVRTAIHNGSGVRLSGLLLWSGTSMRGVRGELRQLVPLLAGGSAEVILQRHAMDAYDAAPAHRHALVGVSLIVTSVDERRGETHTQERHFGIAQARGCYWITLHPAAAPALGAGTVRNDAVAAIPPHDD